MLRAILTRRAAALLTTAGLGVLALPAGAHAATPGASCASDSSLSEPFAAWGDENSYRLLPGGDFTDGAPGWTLGGGAATVPGGDPFGLTPEGDAGSLSLPAGATALSPFTCVDATQPTFRLLGTALAPASSVAVSVVYSALTGPVSFRVGTLRPGGTWTPSPAYENGAAIAGALNGGTAQMAIQFTGLTGSSQLDDVFVDPRMGWGG